jgi:hypothetical protein
VVIGLLIVAIAAAILTWILLNGTNPIHFSAPPAKTLPTGRPSPVPGGNF